LFTYIALWKEQRHHSKFSIVQQRRF